MGEIVQFIKSRFPKYKIALLTNGTLFSRPDIRAQVTDTDLIIVSVDAASEEVFQRINRPHPRLHFSTILDGLVALRKEYAGQLWVEVFLVPGINDSDEEIRSLRKIIDRIGPDKVQLNTLDRPGTEKWIAPLDEAGMARVAACIHRGELIRPAIKDDRAGTRSDDDIVQRILAAIRRRPCTLTDISIMVGCPESDVIGYVETMLENKMIDRIEMNRGIFYKTQPS